MGGFFLSDFLIIGFIFPFESIKEDFDWTKTDSLGLHLVRLLTEQLQCQISLENHHGLKCKDLERNVMGTFLVLKDINSPA